MPVVGAVHNIKRKPNLILASRGEAAVPPAWNSLFPIEGDQPEPFHRKRPANDLVPSGRERLFLFHISAR